MGAAAYGSVLGAALYETGFNSRTTALAARAACAKLEHLYLGAAELRSEMTRPYGEERARRSK
jgi:hypothetical protein